MTEGQISLIEVRLDRNEFQLDIRFEWQARSLVLFGASGSGKTTLLRVLLGLEPTAKARIRLAGTWLENREIGVNRPIHERRLGWVPQSPTLFPDRSVEENIRFGSARGRGKEGDDEDGQWISRAIEICQIESLLKRNVEGLSGGERQRVALARAIATRPRALLLDEPMASLDVGLRSRILPYLLRIRDEFDLPLLYITHDPDEAILLGDEIAVLDRGRLIAQGPPKETLWSQSVHSLASGIGVENVLEMIGRSDGQADDGMSRRVESAAGLTLETPWPLEVGKSLTIGIRAEDILVSLDRPSRISARNVVGGRVVQIDVQAEDARVAVDVTGERLVAKLTAHAVSDLSLRPGSNVYLIIKSQALRRVR